MQFCWLSWSASLLAKQHRGIPTRRPDMYDRLEKHALDCTRVWPRYKATNHDKVQSNNRLRQAAGGRQQGAEQREFGLARRLMIPNTTTLLHLNTLMYGQLSQAPPTHQAPSGARLKEALRLVALV